MVVLLTKATKFMLKWQQKVLKISSAPLQKKSIRFCQVCSHPNNTLLMKYILQKWKGVKLGTWTIKNYWPCKQRKDVGNTYLQYLIRIIQSIYIYIYINNILCIEHTPTCFNESASPSVSIILQFCYKRYKIN